MIEKLSITRNSFNSYIENNRVKIDEALVSLRFMKEVDDFLETNNIKQKEFANNLGYSEAFISQLMSGTKRINVPFINKLEKYFDIKIDFKINSKDDFDFMHVVSNMPLEMEVDIIDLVKTNDVYTFQSNYNKFSQIESDYLKLDNYER